MRRTGARRTEQGKRTDRHRQNDDGFAGERDPPLSARDRRNFSARLLAWYDRYGRDLPWRRTRDPYRVLVAEVMLQQTQVDRVVPKYHEWLVKYPSLGDLSAADEADAVRTWYPLG